MFAIIANRVDRRVFVGVYEGLVQHYIELYTNMRDSTIVGLVVTRVTTVLVASYGVESFEDICFTVTFRGILGGLATYVNGMDIRVAVGVDWGVIVYFVPLRGY